MSRKVTLFSKCLERLLDTDAGRRVKEGASRIPVAGD